MNVSLEFNTLVCNLQPNMIAKKERIGRGRSFVIFALSLVLNILLASFLYLFAHIAGFITE